MKERREMIVILAGLTMCSAWPFGIARLLSALHAPSWLSGGAGCIAFLLAIWAYLVLQKINGNE
jgi:hypothetical protein